MAVFSVFYYGYFASITGGWVPVRHNCTRQNIILNIAHLIFFGVNLFFPLAVYLIQPDSIVGWAVYALYVLLIFLFLKILNWRIHRAFGKDPETEKEKEEEEEQEEGEGRGEGEEGGQPASGTGGQGDGSAVGGAAAVTGGQQHVDVEVHPQPATGLTVVATFDGTAAGAGAVGAQASDPNGKDATDPLHPIKEESSAMVESFNLEPQNGPHGETPVPMSPVHVSTTSMDLTPAGGQEGAPTTETNIVPADDIAVAQGQQQQQQAPTTSPSSSSSASPPPDRRGSHRQRHCVRQRGSLQAEGGGEGTSDQSSMSRQQRIGSRGPPEGGQPVPPPPPPPPPPPQQQSLDFSASRPSGAPSILPAQSLALHVMTKLAEEGNDLPLEVIIKMTPQVHQAILIGTLPADWYSGIVARQMELTRGHIAMSPQDFSSGAIHWVEADGSWDFYVFEGQSAEPQNDLINDRNLYEDDILAGLDIHGNAANLHYDNTPPTPPHNHAVAPTNGAGPEDTTPVMNVIPCVKRTAIRLTVSRSRVEEYMDRNTTLLEVFSNLFLAVMVSVVAALVFQIGFYQGVSAFLFCWAIGCAHFSLVKSVPCDPASPVPGQYHMAAVSRSVYIIFLGSLALILNAALKTDLSVLCVYGYNIDSRAVLMFVRNGLLIFILFLPVLFALGWLPHFDTLVIYLCEQIDINIFGGTAATGLVCALYGLARSILATALLWLLGWAAFSTLSPRKPLSCTSVNFSPNQPSSEQCSVQSRIALSFFLSTLFTFSYVLSRSTSNYQYLWDLLLFKLRRCVSRRGQRATEEDPLDKLYRETNERRLVLDALNGLLIFAVVTSLNVATTFCHSWIAAYVVYGITCVTGALLHYLLSQARKENPWQCCSEPIITPKEWVQYEITEQPEVSIAEHILQWGRFLEKNILYPLCFLFALNLSAHHYNNRFGVYGAALVMAVVGMKLIRSALADTSKQYLILTFTLLFFNFDYAYLSEGLPLDYFIIAILFHKFYDLFLKMKFVLIYVAPWAISWSSLFHIFIHPFLIPHAHMFFFQLLIGAIMNAPLNPVMGSALFLLSYVRPIKYWEKNYNTKRGDSATARLDTHLDTVKSVSSDKFDSLFYEHLTCVLQKSVAGDLALGRWGEYSSGDIFILTSDRLNALIHIIEVGNGFVTFQLRGLEFRGTYCQQREVEAISESIADNKGCCCNDLGHLPGVLSCNMMVCTRWMSWQVTSSCYTIHGYSITENQANLVFNTYDFKKRYLTYYCKAIIYKLIKFPRLSALLNNEQIQTALESRRSSDYKDVDVLFDNEATIIEDYRDNGILKRLFINVFHPFIEYCVQQQRGLEVDASPDSLLVALCFSYTLLGRRLFFEHSNSGADRRRSGDNFMNGLHRMFLGDARVNSANDEWVFNDPDSIRSIVIPAVRIAVKVHQDNFALSNPYEFSEDMYEAIQDVEDNHIVTHESDHEWRNAVVTNQPSLLALRYHRTEGYNDQPYKLIRLTSKFIKFRVIKLNREGVRSLWTSQQHELIFFQVGDSERGSIQNHKPSLRNIINSSMDPPVGYPIYVSPLQTSYIDGHERFNSTLLSKVTDALRVVKYLARRCQMCSSAVVQRGSQPRRKPVTDVEKSAEDSKGDGGAPELKEEVDPLTGLPYPPANPGTDAQPEEGEEDEDDFWKPAWVGKTVMIVKGSEVFESHRLLNWPETLHHVRGCVTKSYVAPHRVEGKVLHEWKPFHPRSDCRSPVDKCIVLLKIGDQYVLVREPGIEATVL